MAELSSNVSGAGVQHGPDLSCASAAVTVRRGSFVQHGYPAALDFDDVGDTRPNHDHERGAAFEDVSPLGWVP